jgi:hypothetical protein
MRGRWWVVGLVLLLGSAAARPLAAQDKPEGTKPAEAAGPAPAPEPDKPVEPVPNAEPAKAEPAPAPEPDKPVEPVPTAEPAKAEPAPAPEPDKPVEPVPTAEPAKAEPAPAPEPDKPAPAPQPSGNVMIGDPLQEARKADASRKAVEAETKKEEAAKGKKKERKKRRDKKVEPPVEKVASPSEVRKLGEPWKKKKEKKKDTYTVSGASPVDRERTALRIGLGFPEVHLAYHMPFDTNLEFGVGADFFYGLNMVTTGDLYGGSIFGEGRWRMVEKGKHSLTLTGRPAVHGAGGPGGEWLVGFSLAIPGLIWDAEIGRGHHFCLGLQIPWGFFWGKGGEDGKQFAFRIPIAGQLGLEFELSKAVHLFIQIEPGVDIWTADILGGPDLSLASLYARGLIGLGILL